MDYIDEIMDVIQKIAQGDFSVKIDIRGEDDRLDCIANGINMLAEEVHFIFDKKLSYEASLQNKINDLKGTVDFTRDTELRIVEIMKEVDDLRKQLNMPPKYLS